MSHVGCFASSVIRCEDKTSVTGKKYWPLAIVIASESSTVAWTGVEKRALWILYFPTALRLLVPHLPEEKPNFSASPRFQGRLAALLWCISVVIVGGGVFSPSSTTVTLTPSLSHQFGSGVSALFGCSAGEKPQYLYAPQQFLLENSHSPGKIAHFKMPFYTIKVLVRETTAAAAASLMAASDEISPSRSLNQCHRCRPAPVALVAASLFRSRVFFCWWWAAAAAAAVFITVQARA